MGQHVNEVGKLVVNTMGSSLPSPRNLVAEEKGSSREGEVLQGALMREGSVCIFSLRAGREGENKNAWDRRRNDFQQVPEKGKRKRINCIGGGGIPENDEFQREGRV